MRNTIFYAAIILCIAVAACKKPNKYPDTVPAAIHFELLDKNGHNLIHSVKDSLVVTYTKDGATVSQQLSIYRVQVSATDTAAINANNAFLVSDLNPATHQGYMSSPSGGGVRNFTLTLNGLNIGNVYLDYWGYLSLSYPPQPSSVFTFNSTPVTSTTISGAYSDGKSIVAQTSPPGDFIELLQSK